MKSYTIQVQGAGTVLELREAPLPVAGAGQMLVRLHAAGLNRGEFIAAHGLHAKSGAPKPAGSEGACGHSYFCSMAALISFGRVNTTTVRSPRMLGGGRELCVTTERRDRYT